MISDLSAPSKNRSVAPEPNSPTSSTAITFPKLLNDMEAMKAEVAFTGTDIKHLLVKAGDRIHIYAYIDQEIAIGFNAQTNLGGKFPISIGQKINPEPHEKTEIFVSKSTVRYGTGVGNLSYEEGQYVRVCRWETGRTWAYGFNLHTFAMGRFNTKAFKQIIWA